MKCPVPTPKEVVDIAVELLSVHCPDADSAFVAGSFMRGQGSAASDIDLVVLYPSLAQAYRESFIFKDIPVETFVHDPETLSWFLEQDRKDGRPALIGMLIEGIVIGPRQDTGHAFKKRALKLFVEGPPTLSTDAIERLRYAITDKLDDLETDRTPAERIAIGAALYPLLVELALRGSSRWNGNGKWCARLLSQMNISLAQQVETAFLSLYDGSDTQAVLRLAENLLDQHGGRLFSGYHSDAPAGWRSPFIRSES
jgi:predicted nucleotidyltransferase